MKLADKITALEEENERLRVLNDALERGAKVRDARIKDLQERCDYKTKCIREDNRERQLLRARLCATCRDAHNQIVKEVRKC